MGSNNLAVYTTVYPAVLKYLGEWATSISQQSDSNFDLWIGIDSLSTDQVRVALGKDLQPNWILSSNGESPTQIRIKAINKLANSYSAVVFVDSDDVLDRSRVESARRLLEDFDVVGCALKLIDERAQDLGLTFGVLNNRDIESLWPRYNVFGLSNTAYRSSILQRCVPLSDESELVDWQLATRAWMSGAAFGFDQTPRMFYRQYADNIARVLQPFDEKYVWLATIKVLAHYRCLLTGKAGIPVKYREVIEGSFAQVQTFHQSIFRSAATLRRYVQSLNKMTPEYVWWWCVAHPELESIWKN